MADVCTTMPSDGESPAQCREARRCSIDPSRSRASAAAGESSSRGEKRLPSPEPDPSIGEKRIRTKEPGPPSFSAEEAPPSPFGCVSLCGLSREMEDAVSVRPGFCRRAGGEPLDFFGVFDGHGGAHVSTLCRERMHELVAEEMGRVGPAEGEWKEAVAKAFARMDEVALESCACGRVGPGPGPCPCDRSGFESDIVGSTAVIAIVGRDRVLVANCGDSRAVLSRAGRALPLSVDHKPDRPDELARIEAAGGRVIYLNGARVHGILAMSRAVGDKYLKPVVISDPEIVVIERRMEDECLIIASDGLWDVLSNELACDVARRCLQEGAPLRYATGAMSGGGSGGEGERQASDTRCSMAAALLARLALGRKSGDNISVIVIDLKSGSGHQLSR